MDENPEMILAKPWDVIVCENNHACLLVLRMIRGGDPIRADDFCAIGRMQQPQQGQEIVDTRCPECGKCLFNEEWYFSTGWMRSNSFKVQERGQ
jgi:hypothetical protein